MIKLTSTTFQSNTDFAELEANTYTVTVKDANGCLDAGSATVDEPDALGLTVNQNDDSFTLSATGGIMPYEYSSDGTTFQSGTTFSNIEAGNYSFTLRDANYCTVQSETFSVVLGSIVNPNVHIYPNPVASVISIKGIDYVKAVIFDLNGKELVRSTNKNRIDLGEIRSGVLLLHLYDKAGNIIYEQRVIKK
ncbi:MAG: T9SS type A sorting domain-containing protein [Marinoscillum sp.]